MWLDSPPCFPVFLGPGRASSCYVRLICEWKMCFRNHFTSWNYIYRQENITRHVSHPALSPDVLSQPRAVIASLLPHQSSLMTNHIIHRTQRPRTSSRPGHLHFPENGIRSFCPIPLPAANLMDLNQSFTTQGEKRLRRPLSCRSCCLWRTPSHSPYLTNFPFFIFTKVSARRREGGGSSGKGGGAGAGEGGRRSTLMVWGLVFQAAGY